MVSIFLVLVAIAMLGLSGLPACFLTARSLVGQRVAAAMMGIGSLVGLCGMVVSLGLSTSPSWQMPWLLPWGQFSVSIDPISALFLGPVFVVPALGSFYGLGYWKQSEHPDNGRQLGLFYGVLAAAMGLVVIARDGILFLIVWEVMALAAYFAATTEEHNPEVRRAGWVYLIATHVGTLCLIAMFALWHYATDSFALQPVQALPAALCGTLFVLVVVGFGFKAGLMPLHVWLPGAHANAPSHVSAVMSGVMLKMGIYGMVRMTALMPLSSLWGGGLLLVIGVITGLAGIAFAMGQHDLKRLLAYSSIENIGVIVMGLGLALLGRTLGHTDWVMLGLGGALLHVCNHSLFKSLLFFNIGAVIHAMHTRNMNQLGGLAKQMPQTTALFVVGAIGICALPPLNGFASEWLLYIGLFRTLNTHTSGFPAAAVAVVALGVIGAMAVACFVKLLGTVFLGTARSEHVAHDPQATMRMPMAILSAGCVGIGLFPMAVVPLLERAVHTWVGLPISTEGSLMALAPLQWLSVLGLVLIACAGALVFMLKLFSRSKTCGKTGTWDCGYAQPTARMQYTGASFVQSLADLFSFVLWPQYHWPTIRGFFPKSAHFRGLVPDVILDRLVVPLFNIAGRHLPRLRILQQGQTHLYVLYILVIMIVLLAWGAMGILS